MQPSTTTIAPAPIGAPARPLKAKRPSSDPFRRDPLACRLMDAVAPILVPDTPESWKLAPGLYGVDAYRALLPICRDYTVADAARAFMSIQPMTRGMHGCGTARDTDARVEARDVLEAFIVTAAPSSPDDVLALAEHLALRDAFDPSETVVSSECWPAAAQTLADGIKDWRRGEFNRGETFGSAGNGTNQKRWLYRAAKAANRLEFWFGRQSKKAKATDQPAVLRRP